MNHDYDDDVMLGDYGEEAAALANAIRGDDEIFKQFLNDRTYYKYDISIEDIEKVRDKHRPPFTNLVPDYSEINLDYMSSAIDRIMKISQENEEIAMICDMAILYLKGVHPVGISSTDMTSAVEQNELFMKGYSSGYRNGLSTGKQETIDNILRNIDVLDKLLANHKHYNDSFKLGGSWAFINIVDYIEDLRNGENNE